MTEAEIQAAALWGIDHADAATCTVRAVGDTAAIGIARGWRPKPYWYLDPNEDVAAVVVGTRATLLVVADGHHGHESSHAAVAAVLDYTGFDPPAELDDAAWLDMFEAAAESVEERVRRAPPDHHRSKTTLVVALLAGRALRWAGVGDSLALVAGGAVGEALWVPRQEFLGPTSDREWLAPRLRRGTMTVGDDAWVVLATDGFTEWAPAPLGVGHSIRTVVRRAATPTEAVEKLLEAARLGGAGDNVALAVAAPPPGDAAEGSATDVDGHP